MRQKEELLEVDRFGFEKTQSENLKKGADPRLGTAKRGWNRTVCSGGGIDGAAGLG